MHKFEKIFKALSKVLDGSEFAGAKHDHLHDKNFFESDLEKPKVVEEESDVDSDEFYSLDGYQSDKEDNTPDDLVP